jgi:16S rRNA (cytidine1402-2'-O)-methyltransferase
MDQGTGTLFVVATPIGNLQDMQPRSIEVLKSVALIAAEDSRHSGPLLRHFEVATPVMAYHDHSDRQRTDAILSRLLGGEDVALISDAGTPLISDPGYRLVDMAHQKGVRVCPVPGACAMVAALSASGLPTDRFSFAGFLPAKSQARINVLSNYLAATDTTVFYEAPHRLLDTLQDMLATFGSDRVVVLARELTKMFETVRRLPLDEMVAWVASDSNQQRGECVLLLKGVLAEASLIDGEVEHVMRTLAAELPLKQAASLASKITGHKKNALYQWGLDVLKT